jgi:hypothetical protein
VARTLAAKLRPADPSAKTEVIVSVAHDAPFSKLTKLRRDLPRTSTENSQRLATRLAEIASVDVHRKPWRSAVVGHARGLGALVMEEFTMGNAIAMTIPDTEVAQLASHPYVLDVSPRYVGTPPPATISDGTGITAGMNSDFWRTQYDGRNSSFFVVSFDTGVRSTHTLFLAGDSGILEFHRDCSRGNSTCLNSPVNPAYDDQDGRWNHGTGAASIMLGGNSNQAGFGLSHRGVSRMELDYLNVYSNDGGDSVAVSRAFQVAAGWGDDIIVGELQFPLSDTSAMSLAADDAFDQGIATLGACGNTGIVTSPAAPGNAHKALSIGDYEAGSGSIVSQVPGLVDGRVKPDIQAPTNVSAASASSNTGKRTFNGTSGATAFAGGAASLMYDFLQSAAGINNKPGNLYTSLIVQGDSNLQPSTPNGSGKLKMVSGSLWWVGQVTLATSQLDVSLPVPSGYKNLRVAIWWPERHSDAHNDVDLKLLIPGGTTVGISQSTGSVWEKTQKSAGLAAGTYKLRVVPFSMPRPSQVVYYSAVAELQ